MNIFTNISELEKNILLKEIKPIKKEYLRGETIVTEGDLCSSIILVNRGSITAKQSFSDGHDNIIRIINQNEYIGINLIFSSNPFYKATFYSDTLTSVTLISKDDLVKLMTLNTTILYNVLALISDSAISLNEHIRLLSHKSIKSKLCYYLYNEYKRSNQLSFIIPYTKTELAAFLNVERPSLSYELNRLIDAGIIANKNKLYTIIDLDKIKKYI